MNMNYLDRRTERTHEERKNPTLKQSCLKLERYREDGNDDIRCGQVGDEEIGHRAQTAGSNNHVENHCVARGGRKGDSDVRHDKERHNSTWNIIELVAVI